MTNLPHYMVNSDQIIAGRLRDEQISSLFEAFADDSAPWATVPYLRGDINGTDVRVALGGETRFEVNETKNWPNRPGFLIKNVRIEVDRGSAEYRRTEEDCKRGEIVVHPSGCSLIAADGLQKHIVDLFGTTLNPDVGLVMIAFKRWEVVTGEGVNRQVLYHYTGSKLLFGPFDPEVDDLE